jgi:hypothetical protein
MIGWAKGGREISNSGEGHLATDAEDGYTVGWTHKGKIWREGARRKFLRRVSGIKQLTFEMRENGNEFNAQPVDVPL